MEKKVKKVVRITEGDLNKIILKTISEQEAQVMTTGPSPEQVAGTPDTGAEDMADSEPNFEEFVSCAKGLLDQGVTVGTLVDKLLEAQEDEGEPEVDDQPAPDTEGGVEPEVPMN